MASLGKGCEALTNQVAESERRYEDLEEKCVRLSHKEHALSKHLRETVELAEARGEETTSLRRQVGLGFFPSLFLLRYLSGASCGLHGSWSHMGNALGGFPGGRHLQLHDWDFDISTQREEHCANCDNAKRTPQGSGR